jgi:hypothetical protein
MPNTKRKKDVLLVFFYMYMFAGVPALVFRLVYYNRTTESLLLIPLTVFSLAYGLLNFRRITTPVAEE